MNGKKAKQFRKKIYGEEFSPKFREYTGESRLFDRYSGMWNQYGTITADWRRQAYQKMKKEYKV